MLEFDDVFMVKSFQDLRLLSQQADIILVQILPPNNLQMR